jgi:hypothetical protein
MTTLDRTDYFVALAPYRLRTTLIYFYLYWRCESGFFKRRFTKRKGRGPQKELLGDF